MLKQSVTIVPIKGMNLDISPSKMDNQTVYEMLNMRITASQDNTLLAVVNEKGNSKVTLIEKCYTYDESTTEITWNTQDGNGYSILTPNSVYESTSKAPEVRLRSPRLGEDIELSPKQVKVNLTKEALNKLRLDDEFTEEDVNLIELYGLTLPVYDNYLCDYNSNIVPESSNNITMSSIRRAVGDHCNVYILGVVETTNGAVIFTKNEKSEGCTDSGGLDTTSSDNVVYITPGTDKDTLICTTIFSGNLNFDKEYLIEGLFLYETENVLKVYWVDGLNLPRVVNISLKALDNRIRKFNGELNDTPPHLFDFVPELRLEENITVTKLNSGGYFPSGVILYAFTYYNKYLQESKMFYITPINYLCYDKGLSPEVTTNCSFTITINNIDHNFDYIRIYSITRTHLNGTLSVKRVVDLDIRGLDENVPLSFTDSGTIGYPVDSNYLLYSGGLYLIAGTLTLKDNTLFLGNFINKFNKVPDAVKSAVKDCTILTPLKSIEIGSTDYLNYKGGLKGDASQITSFKVGNTYRIGVVFLYNNGDYSDVCYIKDVEIDQDVNFDGGINAPYLEISDLYEKIKSSNFVSTVKKAMLVMVLPTMLDRTVLALGMLCPTIYFKEAHVKNSPGLMASWLMRPFDSSSEYIPGIYETGKEHLAEISNSLKPTGSDLPASQTQTVTAKINISLASNLCFGTFYCVSLYILNKLYGETSFKLVSLQELYTLYYYNNNFLDFKDTVYTGTDQCKVVIEFYKVSIDNTKLNEINILKTRTASYSLAQASGILSAEDFRKTTNPRKQLLGNNSEAYTWLEDIYKIYTVGSAGFTGPRDFADWILDGYGVDSGMAHTIPIDEYNNNKYSNILLIPIEAYRQYSIDNITDNRAFFEKKIVTFNSPEVNEHSYQLFDKKSFSLKINKKAVGLNDATQFANYRITMDSTSLLVSSKAKGARNLEFLTTFYNRFLWNDFSKDTDDNSNNSVFAVYLFNRLVLSDSLPPEINKEDPNARTTLNSLLKTKIVSNTRWFNGNEPLDYTKNVPIDCEVFNYTEPTQAIYTDNGLLLYWGNVDYLVSTYKQDVYPVAVSYADLPQSAFNWPKLEDVKDRVNSNLLGVQITYRSLPHLVLDLKGSAVLEEIDNGYLIGEICQSIAPYGGPNPSESMLRSHVWIPIGIPYKLGKPIIGNQGDTYVMRWDCLKTAPLRPDDFNQVIDITSFYVESYINLDGRYDSHRGKRYNLEITHTNFNIRNEVYDLLNNYMTYQYTGIDYNTEDVRNASVTWSMTKMFGEDVDLYTKIIQSNVLDLDGGKGLLLKLTTFKNNIFAFLNKGIAQILYNENYLIQTELGLPIEIANSGKIGGYRYIEDGVGCLNKASVVQSYQGIYFVDNWNKDIFIFTGELALNLSVSKGMHSWVHNISGDISQWKPDTFNNVRTLYSRSTGDVYFVTKDLCLAYNETVGAFTSFYSYNSTPYMFNIQDATYQIKNNVEDRSIYKMFAGEYNKIYDAPVSYSITTLPSVDGITDKVFSNVTFRADAYKNDTYNSTITFNLIKAWNEYLNTDYVNLVYNNHSTLDNNDATRPTNRATLKKKFRSWHCDIPRNKYDENNTKVTGRRDRIRNPWTYVELKYDSSNSDSDNNDHKNIIKDITIDYYV